MLRILPGMALLLGATLFLAPHLAFAQTSEVVPDTVTYVKAQVLQIISQQVKDIPGTGTQGTYQTIKVKILGGGAAGQVITIDNDYLSSKVGDVLYLMHTVNRLEGKDLYAVSELYRLPTLLFFIGLFLVCLFAFGGRQGIRGLLALLASFFFIGYVLLPGILAGYPPVLVAVGVSAIIIVAGSYITHGFNKTTSVAVLGMLATILITGALAWAAIHFGRLSGFTSEEATYLNFDTRGSIDFVGLLLGSLMIGLLGVLYDAAIGQAVAVEELLGVGGHLTQKQIFERALRIGREHIGALVNTLAIAYVGASLPLLLLFKLTVTQNPAIVINQELFATEILRMMIGSIGLILAVPITTAVAVYWLARSKRT